MIRGFCRAALALLVATLGLGGYVGYLQLSGNVHSVVAGEIYRRACAANLGQMFALRPP